MTGLIDMDKNEMSCEVENLDVREEKKKQKSYTSPNLIDLGKMKRVTLGKDVSKFDDENLSGIDYP